MWNKHNPIYEDLKYWSCAAHIKLIDEKVRDVKVRYHQDNSHIKNKNNNNYYISPMLSMKQATQYILDFEFFKKKHIFDFLVSCAYITYQQIWYCACDLYMERS